jgi:hypothetical protein
MRLRFVDAAFATLIPLIPNALPAQAAQPEGPRTASPHEYTVAMGMMATAAPADRGSREPGEQQEARICR